MNPKSGGFQEQTAPIVARKDVVDPFFRGPCGEIPKATPVEYRPNELLIALHDRMVTAGGFHSAAVELFQFLFSHEANRIETLRDTNAFCLPLHTGKVGAPWTVGEAKAVELADQYPDYWVKAPGARWVGLAGAQEVAPTDYTFTLPLGSLAGGDGEFELEWAADNMAAWTIDGGGTLNGVTSSPAADAGDSYRTLHKMSGTFGPASKLKAVVTNTTSFANPMGLLVQGYAGRGNEFDRVPGQLTMKTPHRVRVDYLAAETKAATVMIRAEPGKLPATPAIPAPPLWPIGLQQELRFLYVYFNTQPGDDLIRCLRNLKAVKFAERMPVGTLQIRKPGHTGSAVGEIHAGVPLQGGSVPHPGQTQGNLRLKPDEYKSAVNWVTPGDYGDGKNLIILDGPYKYPNKITHGVLVAQTALSCMPKAASVVYRVITEPDEDNNDNAEISKINPSRYFSVLRDVAAKPSFRKVAVLNISRGTRDWTLMERDCMKELEDPSVQILVVAAAGQYNPAPARMVDFPAAFDTVLSVGGVKFDSTLSSDPAHWDAWLDANFRFDVEKLKCLQKKDSAIDVVAPIDSIDVKDSSGSWVGDEGTSFAAPIVAAMCSALRNKNPSLSPAEVRRIVRNAVKEPLNKDAIERCGFGLIRWNIDS